MTSEEIQKMVAGQQMDAQVGQYVMGLRTIRADWEPHNRGIQFDKVLPYSTDISAAWQVVEKLHPSFSLRLQQDKDDPVWYVAFWKYASSKRHVAVEESVALAICKAALLTTLK